MVFPPEVSPRDKWITKAQRQEAADSLYVAEKPDEDDADEAKGWHTYLMQVRLYMHALVIPGGLSLSILFLLVQRLQCGVCAGGA